MQTTKLVLLIILLSGPAFAQYTNVSAQVLDPSNNVYVNCTVSASFVNNTGLSQLPLLSGSTFQTQINGISCDSNGNFTLRLADSNAIAPAGTQWKFSICAKNGTIPCFSYTSPACPAAGCITGASITITTALQGAAAPIPSSQVSSVTATAPVLSSGGANPVISVNKQGTDINLLTSGTISGTLSPLCTDASGGATTASCPIPVTSVTASAPLGSSGGATPNITVANKQGVDTNLLTSGTVTGTGSPFCTDVNGGATTSGCPVFEQVLGQNFQAPPVTVNAAVSTQQSMMSISGFSNSFVNAINKQFRMHANGQFTGFINQTEQVQLGFQINSTNVTLATFIPAGTLTGSAADWTYDATCIVTTPGSAGILNCFSEVRLDGGNGIVGFPNPISKMTNNISVSLNLASGTLTPNTIVSFQTASATNSCTQNLFYFEQLN